MSRRSWIVNGSLAVVVAVVALLAVNSIFHKNSAHAAQRTATATMGTVQATMTVPAGWVLDKSVPVTIAGPLSTQRLNAVEASVNGTKLVATFNKADIDNNVPAGDQEPLTVSADFIAGGAQKKLQGTAQVKVLK